ncbi:hypothetical protein [Nonomuraea maritima]|uniref:hypothetical protein n=1 Tax=Nonomuraea maritima TaxID=683260 RepID=UPI0015A2C9E3|nr:hypothetical protein [Nonomuraea maritima]
MSSFIIATVRIVARSGDTFFRHCRVCGVAVRILQRVHALTAAIWHNDHTSQRLHADQDLEWVDDTLPDLAGLREEGRRFDLIPLTAVWMHLDEQQRAAAMPAMVSLLDTGGRVILSLRHGPVPIGRRMFPVSAAETIALARTHGLDLIHLAERVDPHGRQDISWTYLALQR